MSDPLRGVIIGCGMIAGQYAEALQRYRPQVALRGFADLDPARARAFASRFEGRAYGNPGQVYADPEVDLVINLTIHRAHGEVSAAALRAGKHVFSEKPLAMSHREALELLSLAEANRRELCCAPGTFLGEAQQALGAALRRGDIGRPLLIYAAMNHGRIEEELPDPRPFYDAGPLRDVAVYPLSVIAAFLGPFSSTELAHGEVLLPTRKTTKGEEFALRSPDSWFVVLKHSCGAFLRLTSNFVVNPANTREESRLEIHGDLGSLSLESPFAADAAVAGSAYGKPLAAVAAPRTAARQIDWARPIAELAEAISAGARPRSHASLAAHVTEVVESIHACHARREAVQLHSTFNPPPLLPWALQGTGA